MTDAELIDWLAENALHLQIVPHARGIRVTLQRPGPVDVPWVIGSDYRAVVIALAQSAPSHRVLCATCRGEQVKPACPACGVTFKDHFRARMNRPIIEV